MKKTIVKSKPDLNQASKRTAGIIETIRFDINAVDSLIGQGKLANVQTYGCQGNVADGDAIIGLLEKLGYKITDDENQADLILLNTCAVREGAENKIWGIVGRLKRVKKARNGVLIGLCGCMAQEETTITTIQEKYPQIDLVFGTHNIHELPHMLKQAMSGQKLIQVYSDSSTIVEELPRVREYKHKAFVNIMYGCDEFCSYCIVPYTRGKKRSRAKADIFKEIDDLILSGYSEITLLGQNVNAYGTDFEDSSYSFGDLLDDLAKTNLKRLRFTTNHPHYLDEKTIKAMANHSMIMPHLHLPVQAGSNRVLELMNRKYTKEEYLEKINLLKVLVPGISITTDIIVGFSGESQKDFEETLDLVKEAAFEGAFTFIYSKREGTPAALFKDDTSIEEKKLRLKTLNTVVNEGYLKGHKRFVGEIVEVLVDGVSKNNELILSGYSQHNKLVNFPGDKSLIGKLVSVKITKANTWFMSGELI
ncbi:MAG: tRNA (N6-isopentenyl adenosine(37)-C2)-methylthiotransferase MiaB [Erysipelotrichales bacterium]|nr:tRNA (N6-isopentenyl adenosine(37)-C2)-methylthiotransferase MiaB [Erysipelotrichales bacterium]